MHILAREVAVKRDLHLRDSGIFSGLTPGAMEVLSERGVFVGYDRELIAREDEPVGFFYFVVQGVVDITKRLSSNEGETVLASLVPGQCFGEMSLLLDAPASANVRAREVVVAWAVRHPVLRHFFCHHPEGGKLIGNIAALLAQRLVQTNQRLVS